MVTHLVDFVFQVERFLLKAADGVLEVERLRFESGNFQLFVIAMLALSDVLSTEFLDLNLLFC